MVSRMSVRDIIVYSVISLLVVGLLAFTGYTLYDKTNVADNIFGKIKSDEEVVHVDNVSSENMDRLREGTSLSFGDPTKPFINLIVTPQDISRSDSLVGEKPSDLLNAVKDKEILLNIYLTGEDGLPNDGINSILKAASCNTFRDETPGKIATLSRIIENVDTINATDDYRTIARKMGIEDKVIDECESDESRKNSIDNSSTTTENNTLYFMQQFNISGKPSYIIVDGQSADRIDVFKDGWVQNVIDGKPIMSMFRDDVIVQSAENPR